MSKYRQIRRTLERKAAIELEAKQKLEREQRQKEHREKLAARTDEEKAKDEIQIQRFKKNYSLVSLAAIASLGLNKH